MPTAHELSFLAPIPRGHDVLLVTFTMEGKSRKLVLDRTASCLYCPFELWGPVHQDPALAVVDPVALITRFTWTAQSTTSGVCAGAMVSTNQYGGERYEVKTLLLIDAATAPYR